MKTIRQAVTSSTLAFAEVLKDDVDDNTSWRLDLKAFHFRVPVPRATRLQVLGREEVCRRGLSHAEPSGGGQGGNTTPSCGGT